MHGDYKRKARMEALMEMFDVMEDMEKEEFEGMEGMPMPEKMKKVTVAAPDEEGLKEGLSKADELLEQYKDMSGMEEMGDAEEEESEEEKKKKKEE